MARRGDIDRPGAATSRRPRAWGDFGVVALMLAILASVYLLDVDTSLSEVRRIGRLTACMPPAYPPLVTGEAQAPGFDVELLGEIAARIGVGLTIQSNAAMVRDFNPRSWRITRAQCQILAGGVVSSQITRSFLDTTDPYLKTGWALVSPAPVLDLEGKTVAFLAGPAGLDRIALSRLLRAAGATVTMAKTRDDLIEGLAAGRFDAGASEALMLSRIASEQGWSFRGLDTGGGDNPISLGLWKGDLTLKNAVSAILADLRRNGFMTTLADRYGVTVLTD